MAGTNVVNPEEVDYFIQSLKTFEIVDIGNKFWFDNHEILLKLNQQAVLEASEYREEVVKDLLVNSYKKINILVHESYCVSIWKTKVLPKIFKIDPNPNATFILYTILFHEANCISFLETVLYHEDSIICLEDSALDLIDYCAQAITRLIGLANIGHTENTFEEFERQQNDLNYKIGLKCLTILSYMIDKIEKCPLSACNRLMQIHDIPCLLSEILHLKPWVRRVKEFEKFIDGKWIVVKGEDLLKVVKTEAQTWFALRQILFNNCLFQYYELNEFRQRELTKCQALLNENLLDQLPPLVEMKQFLCGLTVTGHKKKDNLIMEELPEIRDRLITNAKSYGWKKIAEKHGKELLISDQSEICEMAKRLNTAYNTDLLADLENNASVPVVNCCAQCSKCAQQKCSQCEIAYYCSRDCQVKHWKIHKTNCFKIK